MDLSLAAVLLAVCSIAEPASVFFKQGGRSLTRTLLNDYPDFITVPPGLNPGDAGVQEWAEDFDPSPLIEAFLPTHSSGKRQATADEGSMYGGIPSQITSGINKFNEMNPVKNYTSPFNSGIPTDFNNITNQMSGYNPMNNIVGGFSQGGGDHTQSKRSAQGDIIGNWNNYNPMNNMNMTNPFPTNFNNITDQMNNYNPMNNMNMTNPFPTNFNNITDQMNKYNPMNNGIPTNFNNITNTFGNGLPTNE